MPGSFLIRRAAAAVAAGGVIAYPTEGVYGLGCDPENEDAVARLLDIKQRPAEQGLILIAAHIDLLNNYFAPLPEPARQQLEDSWPGPQTWLVPAADSAPEWITGRHTTIAVRVTDHPVASALCASCGHALVSTSANITGHPPARSAHAVRRMMGEQLDYILSGPVGRLGGATPIRDLRSGQLIRA
ncbi:MAG: threonylcarbamoyl-AMP synthase [Gammaproteobacteria bacterium]|nr:threonylcarbamoyl-AMP synthase [Gammaproteobacteria bacterium]NNF60358.1 threonylcarbamoyl-AMP synthase [Gammaproteobacteria bacterium]NNM20598.1 threonylcarbamoyl-AMP synthase [Gammaproteobacteria bacterium]